MLTRTYGSGPHFTYRFLFIFKSKLNYKMSPDKIVWSYWYQILYLSRQLCCRLFHRNSILMCVYLVKSRFTEVLVGFEIRARIVLLHRPGHEVLLNIMRDTPNQGMLAWRLDWISRAPISDMGSTSQTGAYSMRNMPCNSNHFYRFKKLISPHSNIQLSYVYITLFPYQWC